MGSFWGHIDEAIFFIILSVWWLCHIFPEYIRKQGRTEEIRIPLSYGFPGKRRIPIEIYFKIGFTLFGFAAEIISDGWFHFLDEEGNFRKLVNLQHMGIYGIFAIHGFIDLLQWYGLPMMKNANFLSVSLAFIWYGVGFMFHARMEGKEPLESIVHILPVTVMFGAAACGILRIIYKDGVVLPVCMAYCVLVLGTWFFHVPFMLYVTDKFPGNEPSDWDRSDPRNVAFAVAIFGSHICLDVVFMCVLYVIIYCVMVRKNWAYSFSVPYHDDSSRYQKLPLYDVAESSLDTPLGNGKHDLTSPWLQS